MDRKGTPMVQQAYHANMAGYMHGFSHSHSGSPFFPFMRDTTNSTLNTFLPASSRPDIHQTAPQSYPNLPESAMSDAEERTACLPEGGNEGIYNCPSCDKVFTIPARLHRHMRTHTGEKPFSCEFCEKTFSVKENLNVHRRIHTKERPFSCSICGRAFEHSGKLHRHMRIHTGERPHKCQICDKTFVQSGQLVIHMRAHTGEKPYSCSYCIKAFTCSKQLKVHIRTHTGEKPYSCDICGKTFGYNHVLKMHKMSHLGERLYKCTICDKFFSSRKTLDSHIKQHSEVDDDNSPLQIDLNIDATENEVKSNKKATNGSKKTKPRAQKIRNQNLNRIIDAISRDTAVRKPDEYFSDDSGCGTSPPSVTPPISPEQGYQSSYSNSSSPVQNNLMSPESHESNLFSLLSVRKDLHEYEKKLPSNWYPEGNSNGNSQCKFSLTSISSSLEIVEPESLQEENFDAKLFNDSKIAVFTTQSGERLACPMNVLMKLSSNDKNAYTEIKNELSLRLLKEEARKEKEKKFFATVIVVLESLIGLERMQQFGHPNLHIDEVMKNALELMKTQPCTEPSLSSMDRVKVNLRLLLECCVPDQAMWDQFGWKGKSIEDIVAEFLQQCSDGRKSDMMNRVN